MDIGDPSDIPTTRKKLPSMQELGAFDPEPPASAAWLSAQPSPDPKPPRPTPEQLRVALQRADPATRSKLLRLIAGGRRVDQAPGDAAAESKTPRRLAMNLRQATSHAANAGTAPARAAAPPTQRAAKSAPAGNAGEPLLKIDENTDLLDAAPAALSAEQRKAVLQQQLAHSQIQEPSRVESPAAPKVLFPAYDPREHGDDVRRPARRPEVPAEGHFPAPRQPFQARYQHADGRPMDEAETRVEAVLQEQRCEQTLEVLARDGVNGLLLSPRDLDAAVENGTLDAATATVLWTTWAALRPVIHVIDDDPPARGDNPTDPADPAPRGADLVARSDDPSVLGDAVEAEVGDQSNAEPQGIVAIDAPTIDAPTVDSPEPASRPSPAPAASPQTTQTVMPSPLPAPAPAPVNERSVCETPAAHGVAGPAGSADAGGAVSRAPSSSRTARSAGLLRRLLRGVAIVCVAHSSAQLGIWAWLRWGHWLPGG